MKIIDNRIPFFNYLSLVFPQKTSVIFFQNLKLFALIAPCLEIDKNSLKTYRHGENNCQ